MTVLGLSGVSSDVKAVLIVCSGGVELFDSPILVHEEDEDYTVIVERLCKVELIDTIIVRRSELVERHPASDNMHLRRVWREVYRKSQESDGKVTWVVFVEDELRKHVGLPVELETREAKKIAEQFRSTLVVNLDIVPNAFDPSKMS